MNSRSGRGAAPEILDALGHAFERGDRLDVGRHFPQNGLQVDRSGGFVLDDYCPEHDAGF